MCRKKMLAKRKLSKSVLILARVPLASGYGIFSSGVRLTETNVAKLTPISDGRAVALWSGILYVEPLLMFGAYLPATNRG